MKIISLQDSLGLFVTGHVYAWSYLSKQFPIVVTRWMETGRFYQVDQHTLRQIKGSVGEEDLQKIWQVGRSAAPKPLSFKSAVGISFVAHSSFCVLTAFVTLLKRVIP